MDNISFQGRSQLIFSPKIYKACTLKTEHAYKHLVSGTKPMNSVNLLTAEATSDNVILYMGNEKSGMVSVIPTTEEHPDLLNVLDTNARNLLKKAKDKLTVWIIGGEKASSKNGDDMIRTVNEIAGVVCDKPNIDASILAGGNGEINSVAFKRTADGLNVVVGNNIKINGLSESELSRHYDIAELNNVI